MGLKIENFTDDYVVAREDPLLIFSGMIPGGQDKLEQEFSGRPPCGIRVQLRIDSRQSRVQVRGGSHCHGIAALTIVGIIAHHAQHVV
jgi:hypothetical protein